MNRRGFLGSILALGVAPAVVSSGVLMPVKKLLLPSGEFEFGVLERVTFIEASSPVNFVLMRQLLEAARKKLPYFHGTLPEGGTVQFAPLNPLREVSMPQAG